MIRIFITAVLYLITMFTQAQENKMSTKNGANISSINSLEENFGRSCDMQGFGAYRFQDSKFEVRDKDLTFEIRF